MPDPTFETLWNNVLDRWDEEAPHALFLQHSQMTEQLAEAAARYAGMRGDRERGETAKKRLEAVTLLATSSLFAARTERPRALPKWFTVVVLLLFSALTGYVLLRALR